MSEGLIDAGRALADEASDRGWALLARGEAGQAVACFAAALAGAARDGRARYALGCAQWAAGDRATARASFRAARRELQGRTGPLRALALEKAQAGHAFEARALMRAIVALRPKWPIARADYGAMLLRAGVADAAARQAGFLLRARVRLADGWRLQAMSLFRRRLFAESARAFGELALTSPNDAGAEFAQARALALAGELAPARAAAQRAVDLAPEALRPRLALVRLALALGDSGQARGHLRAAVQIAPGRADLRARLADLLAQNAQYKAAMDMAASACQIDPQNLTAKLTIACCLMKQGKRRKALEALDEIDAAHASLPEVAELRARLAPPTPQAAPAPAEPAPEAPPAPAPRPRVSVPALPAMDLIDHLEIVQALTLRMLRLKYRTNPLGVAIELARPSLVVLAHYYLFYVTMRTMPGHAPIVTFVLAGFSVWFAFNAIEQAASHGSGPTALTGVGSMHVRAAGALWALVFNLGFCLLALVPLNLYGADLPLPSAPLTTLIFLIVAVLAFGLGLTLEHLVVFWSPFKIIGKLLTWVLFVSAGLYFSLADTHPPMLAEIMAYNPVLHLIEYQRSAFVPGYPTALVSLAYPAEVAGALMVFGLVLMRCARTTN